MEGFFNIIGMNNVPLLPIIVKLLLAVVCGGVLGMDRTRKRRAAGMRTYGMVCLGSAVVMMTGLMLSQHGSQWDPARMGAQVVSGIGFIGAGAIIVTGYHEIKGLTTAAGLWVSAGLGLAIGAGYYTVAVIACAALFCVMHFGKRLQDRMMKNIQRVRFYIMLDSAEAMTDLLIMAKSRCIIVSDIEQMAIGNSKNSGVIFSIKLPGDMTQQDAMDCFSQSAGVLYIEAI